MANCTIVGNTASISGGGLFSRFAPTNVTLDNSIVFGNSGIQIVNADGAVTNVTYSNVEFGYVGTGNIATDPGFVSAAGGDYHFAGGSPCIDAGSNPAVPARLTTDLDGNPRFTDDPCTVDTGLGDPPVVDMGSKSPRRG